MNARKWIALALVCGIPALAMAQSVVQDASPFRGTVQQMSIGGIVRADSTAKMLTMDSNGALLVSDGGTPATTFVKKYQSVIQNSLFRTGAYLAAPTTATLAQPQADSCTTKDMIGCNRMALAISYSLDADSLCGSLLCVEVRGHLTNSSDSLSTFLWPWRTGGVGDLPFTAAIVDTVGAMATSEPGASISAFASFHLDTTNVATTEEPVWLNKLGTNRYIWLPIVNRQTGEWFSAPYVSVRVRIIKNYGSTACTAWTGKASPRTSLNIDLVGWR